MSKLAYIRDVLQFDLTRNVPFTREYRVRCSCCAAACINGVPVHERGCPQAVRECNGCNAIIPARQRYCVDCA